MTVSIIIAVKGDNQNLRECIEHCLNSDYPDFEILVLPDGPIKRDYPKTEIIPTGELTPPRKRDIAIDRARGEILAFLDDDAYPAKDWLSYAVRNFSDLSVAAVGGPAVTAPGGSLMQKASGLVYSSYLVSGPFIYRYLPKKRIFVDDFPSCNFLVRKNILKEVGGFDINFWPGEDTFLCLKITKNLKKKIIYDPKVLVYHHRRSLFRGHLKQIANYGLHRGYFVKRFPENSFKISYFLPTLFVLGIVFGLASLYISPILKITYLSALLFYFIMVFIPSINKDFRLTYLLFLGIISSHIVYGLYFIKGILSKRLKEE